MNENSELLKIGEFARRASVSLRTLRYYEELGLISPSARTKGGFRFYRCEDLDRLRLIRDLQELGLTLEHIRDILNAPDPRTSRHGFLDHVRKALVEQQRLVDEQISALESQRARLALGLDKLTECRSCEHVPHEENNYCEPCRLTGTPLPESLRALF